MAASRKSPDSNRKSSPRPKANRRSGVPLTVYLSEELSTSLNQACEHRKVVKSTIVRIAVERFLADLNSGQLNLPLGI